MSAAVELLIYLMEEAFESPSSQATDESQSIIGNLRDVDDRMWRARLPGATRTIESIVLHVGSCKVMYRDYAFGSRSLTWESLQTQPWPDGQSPMADAVVWLRSAHEELMADVRQLNDEDLSRLRWTNWGEQRETRWLLGVLLQHDAYHAGEINRIRSVLAGEDRWQWQIETGIDPIAAAD